MPNSTLLPSEKATENTQIARNNLVIHVRIETNNNSLYSMKNVTEVPRIHEENSSKTTEVTDDIRQTFKNMSLRVHAKRAFAEAILQDADRLGIPYIEGIEHTRYFDDFVAEVDRYKELLDEADERGIEYDLDVYDPESLKQEIEEHDDLEYRQKLFDRSDYYATRQILEV